MFFSGFILFLPTSEKAMIITLVCIFPIYTFTLLLHVILSIILHDLKHFTYSSACFLNLIYVFKIYSCWRM